MYMPTRSTPLMRYAIICAGVAFALAFAASSAYDAWYQREQLYEASERELGNLSQVLAEETKRGVQTVDVLLRDTALWYQDQGRRLSRHEIDQALAFFSGPVSQVAQLTLVDRQGMQQYRSMRTHNRPINVVDRPYFVAHRERADRGMFISEPTALRSIDRTGLVMSRRINDPQGRFDGVIAGVVTLDYLRNAYSGIDLGSHTEMHVVFSNGTPIIGLPDTGGTQSVGWNELGLNLQDGDSTVVRRLFEGRRKVVAAADVQGQPMAIYLVRDEAEVLRAWSTEARNMLVRTVLLMLCTLAAVWLALRQLRRLACHEQALALSEKRYALAMEAANEGHAEWDIVNDVVYLSPRWRDMHFLPAGAEISFAQLRELIQPHPDDRAYLQAAMDDHLRGRTPFLDVDYRMKDPQGGWTWIQARGRVHRDTAGTPLRFYWTTTDISHRKTAEAEKVQLEAQLQHARHLESLGTMAGGIAHDFNNILGAILGYGEMAQRATPAGTPVARYIDRVMQAGHRAKGLVRRIIDFSRSGYGEKSPIPVQPVVEEALTLLQPSLRAGIRLVPRLSAPRAAVVGEVSQIHQIVMNLCTNAIAAIEGEGTVTVSLTREPVRHSQACCLGVLPPGDYVRVQVHDTGRGMDKRTLDRAFDPFFTTRPVGEGAGLGLSVVHGLVTDLGGGIDVKTALGEGSTFTVWIPSPGDIQAADAPPPAAAPLGQGEVIMIVDDEPALVELLEESLAALGYEPVGYTSSEKALQALRSNIARFDLVLTDQQLPGMSGTELVTQMRLLSPTLPAILMTGHGGEGLEARLRDAEINAVMYKPVLAADLAAGIARVLQTARTRQAGTYSSY